MENNEKKGIKIRPFDLVIIAVIAAVIIIGALVLTGHNNFAKSPVEKTETIEFQVMFKGVSLTDDRLPFVKGEKSFITIRNVPYTELEITQVQYAPKKYILEVPNPQMPFVLIDDPTQPFQYDFIITLKDTAKVTDDGAVVGGNKIKIGMPIVLEGYNYRLGGTVSNIVIPSKRKPIDGNAIQPLQTDPQKTNTADANGNNKKEAPAQAPKVNENKVETAQ